MALNSFVNKKLVQIRFGMYREITRNPVNPFPNKTVPVNPSPIFCLSVTKI